MIKIPKPYDEVIITGVASNPSGSKYSNLRAVVATISDDAIKVWPLEQDGKIWFMFVDIEELIIVPDLES